MTGTLGDIRGLAIYVRDPGNLSPLAQALINAFAISVVYPAPVVHQWPNDEVRIAVGSPP